MIASFTGTRAGMTGAQQIAVRAVIAEELTRAGYDTLSHGACTGADEDAHKIAKKACWKTILRPSNLHRFRAVWLKGDIEYEPKPPLSRNKQIVLDGTLLIACPRSFAPEARSGTWSTVRYALRNDKRVILIWPDGYVTPEYDAKKPGR